MGPLSQPVAPPSAAIFLAPRGPKIQYFSGPRILLCTSIPRGKSQIPGLGRRIRSYFWVPRGRKYRGQAPPKGAWKQPVGRPLGGGKRREGKLSRAAWSAHDVWYATSERIRDEGVAGRRPPRPPNISSFCSDIVVCFFAVCPFLSLVIQKHANVQFKLSKATSCLLTVFVKLVATESAMYSSSCRPCL